MIAALLLAAAPYAQAFDAIVVEARHAAWRCEQNVVRDAWMATHINPEAKLEDPKEACKSAWEDYDKARLAYHARHRRSIRRLVPGFRPELEVCWAAFESELNRWTGMPENMAAQECKNAKN